MKKIFKILIMSFFLVFLQVVSYSQEKVVPVIRMKGEDYGAPNPFKNSMRGPGKYKTDIVYDSLIEKDEKGFIPWLAKKWTIDSQKNSILFEIHPNVKWHDNKALTTQDIKFSIEYYDKFPPVVDWIHDNGESIVKNVEILSPNKIRIIFKRYSALNLERIGTMRIIPKHIWEKVDNPLAYTGEGYLVGSGPYKVVEYNSDKGSYAFEAFNHFWGWKPAAERLEWIPVSDPVLALERGEVSIIDISPNVVDRYKNNPKYGVMIGHSFHSYRLLWNQEKVKETQDKDIRKAMAYAINRNVLVDKLERGYGTLSNVEYVISDNPMHNSNVTSYPYSVEKAKKLMKGKEIHGTLLVSNKAKEIKLAELIKLDLEKIGIHLKVKSVDGKSRDNDVKKGNYEFALLKYGDMGGDADYVRRVYASTENNGIQSIQGYKNTELDKILKEQLYERNQKRRKELLYKAQEIIAEEVPMLPLYAENFIYAYRKDAYSNYTTRFDHSVPIHTKLSFLLREKK
ncbi:DNA-binding protein [Fusobacterium necrophorum]|uniref:DNA-binding protein n=1 Tax=Fusobacterium necrophorum TaxID=859 RepID=A0A4Q2L3I6_9FUSO|nr:ABC transporter substrate-binding protein [Fusobacterium necrophorum]RXZ70631.1 DNA-binding protein [Fusobacterium necrophorum]